MRRARCGRLLGIICLCLLPRMAFADAAQARAHFERGRSFFEVDQYRNAIAEFKAAHAEKADPSFLYDVAECHRRLGEAGDALAFYRRYLAAIPPGDKTRPIVEQRIADLKTVADDSKAAAGDAAPGAGNLALNPAPSGADAALPVIEQRAQVPAAEAPLHKRPWFLATVGAVLVATGIAIWGLSRTPEPPDTALGNQSVF